MNYDALARKLFQDPTESGWELIRQVVSAMEGDVVDTLRRQNQGSPMQGVATLQMLEELRQRIRAIAANAGLGDPFE